MNTPRHWQLLCLPPVPPHHLFYRRRWDLTSVTPGLGTEAGCWDRTGRPQGSVQSGQKSSGDLPSVPPIPSLGQGSLWELLFPHQPRGNPRSCPAPWRVPREGLCKLCGAVTAGCPPSCPQLPSPALADRKVSHGLGEEEAGGREQASRQPLALCAPQLWAHSLPGALSPGYQGREPQPGDGDSRQGVGAGGAGGWGLPWSHRIWASSGRKPVASAQRGD